MNEWAVAWGCGREGIGGFQMQTQDQQSPDRGMCPDDEMGEFLEKRVYEAAERVTFHRIELERWGRLGHAAAAGLAELSAHAPVAKQEPEDFGRGARVSAGVPEGASLSEVRR
jgi:hypothetical protein